MRHLLLTIVGCFYFFFATAGVEKYNTRLKAADIAGLPQVMSATDAQYATMLVNPSWSSLFHNKTIKNRVILGIDHASQSFLNSPYTLSVNVDITYYSYSGTSFSPSTVINKTLTISNYGSAGNWKDKSIIEIPGGNLMQVKIISISPVSGYTTNQLNFYLESEIEIERYYAFNPNIPIAPGLVAYNSANLSVNGELEISWPAVEGAEEYDLEWVYVNDYNISVGTFLAPNQIKLDERLFQFNSTRVSTTGTFYSFPYLYGHGYILYRVRPVGYSFVDNYKQLIEGKWSFEISGPLTLDLITANYYTSSISHEDHLNYQASISYAEEGKSKAVVSYFDGSLRNRQSVTKVKSDNNIIVGETFYDHQGRPAVTALPAPTNSNKVDFVPYFNQSLIGSITKPYDKEDFDKDNGGCSTLAPLMDSVSGASRYYSLNSPFLSNEQKYVPTAHGYPFSVTEYTPDNTGRIRRQGGVGSTFQLGNNHETKYFYGQPEQEEIDRLFGAEAGNANRYKKSMTLDANGQLSVSYIDAAGKTVATNLTGQGPLNLDQLGTTQQSTLTIDLLNKTNPANPFDLGVNNKLDYVAGSAKITKEIVIAPSQVRDFEYSVILPKFDTSCVVTVKDIDGNDITRNDHICFDCVADLTISLTDECNNEYLLGLTTDGSGARVTKKTIGQEIIDDFNNSVPYNSSNCTTPNLLFDKGNITNSAGTAWQTNDAVTQNVTQLPVGNYSLIKNVKINEEALEYYTKEYLDTNKNECLIKYSDFLNEEIAATDFSGCNMTCQECVDKLGSYSLYDITVTPDCDPCLTAEEFQEIVDDCNEFCNPKSVKCENAYQSMLMDFSPMGQYGQIMSGGGTVNGVVQPPSPSSFNPGAFPLSVFNGANRLPRKQWLKNIYDIYLATLPSSSVPNWYKYSAASNWRYPYNVGSSVPASERYSYLDYNGDIAYVKVVPNGSGGYTPAIIPGVPPVLISGSLYVEPKFLNYIQDFIAAWQPSWAKSLVVYHPEYADYEYCIAIQLSHDFDEKLLDINTLADLNAAYPGILNNFMNSGTLLNTMDPFFNGSITNASVYNGQTIASQANILAQALDNYTTNGISPSMLNLWQFAYQMANCPAAAGNPGCSPCSQPTFSGYVFSSELEWQIFRSTYLSLKQKLVDRLGIQYAVKHNGYNGCMNTDSFNPFANNFYNTYTVTTTSWFGYPYYFWWWSWSGPPFISQYYNPEQPCNYVNYQLYKEKVPRFPVNSQLIALNSTSATPVECFDPVTGEEMLVCPSQNEEIAEESANLAALSLFSQCGQCPSDQNFQNLLKSLSSKKTFTGQVENDLTVNTSIPLSCYPASTIHPDNTPQLELAMWGINPTGPITWEYDNLNSTSTLLKGNFVQGGQNCQLQISFLNTSTIYNFNDVYDFCCLKATNAVTNVTALANHNFILTGKVHVKAGDPDFLTIPGQEKEFLMEGYVSCLEIGTCDLNPLCKKSQEAQELQNLWNAMLYSEDLTASGGPNIQSVFTNTTTTNLSVPPYSAFLTDNLKNELYASLSGGLSNLAAQWQWNATVLSPTQVIGQLSTPGLTSNCSFTFTIDPASNPTGLTFNDIKQILTIKPVSIGPPGSFIMKVLAQSGTSPAQNLIVNGVSTCLSMGQCDDGLPDGFNTGVSNNTEAGLGIGNCTLNALGVELQNSISTSVSTKGALPSNFFIMLEGGVRCATAIIIPTGSSFSYNDVRSITNMRPDPAYLDASGNTNHFLIDVYYLVSTSPEVISSQSVTISGFTNCGSIGTCVGCSGENIYSNGNFNTGFNTLSPEFSSSYDSQMGQNPVSFSTGSYSVGDLYVFKCGDHTPTSDELALIGRSGWPSTSNVWKKTFTVHPNVNYKFEAWFSAFGAVGGPAYPSMPFEIEVVGIQEAISSGLIFNINTSLCNWTQQIDEFNSGNNTNVEIRIIPKDPNGGWFAIDDIVFKQNCANQPCYTTEIVSDGDFESYNSSAPDFATTYSLDITNSPTSSSFTNGSFNVINMNQIECVNGDHTPANTGNMVLIGRANNTLGNIWQRTFAVEPDKNYDLKAWFQTVNYNTSVPFEINITGNQSLTETSGFTSGITHCGWSQFTDHWNSGTNTSVTIGIKCLSNSGDLFMIDDISLKAECGDNSILCNIPEFPTVEVDPNPCQTQLIHIAQENAQSKYEQYIEDIRNQFRANYIRQCLKLQETFLMKYVDSEHHFTLYYYDQAGNLVRTIPPQGVVKITDLDPVNGRTQPVVDAEMLQIKQDRANGVRTVFTKHSYQTTYKYNSLNQLVSQTLPDHQNMNIFSINPSNVGIPSGYTVNSTNFSSSNNGTAFTTDNSGQGHIFITTNGGTYWSEINALGLGNLNDVVFDNSIAGTAFVVGDNGIVLKTINSGTNWNIVTPPATSNVFRIHLSAGQLYAYGKDGNIYISSDGALTWTGCGSGCGLAALLTADQLSDITFNGSSALAVTVNGKILISSNLTNWSQSNSISSVDQNKVSYSPGGRLYSVGKDGTLLTSLGGNQWDEVFNNLTVELKDVYFTSSSHGFALDISGNLYESTDGGLNWLPSAIIATNVKSMYFNSALEGFAVLNTGQLYKYNGTSWSTYGGISSVNAVSSFIYDPIVSNIGYVGGINATLMIKPAASWISVTVVGVPLTETISELYVNNYNTVTQTGNGWLLTSAGILYNFNISFAASVYTAICVPAPIVGIIKDFQYDQASSSLYAIDNTGTLHTHNGTSWTSAPINSMGSFPALSINVAGGNIAVVGNNGEIWYFSAGSWSSKTQNIKLATLKGVGIDGSSAVYYAASVDGTVLASTNNGLSWTTEVTGSNVDLNDISSGPGSLTAVGNTGNWIYKSGASWNSGSNASFNTIDLTSVIYYSGKAYSAGMNEGIIEIFGASSTPMHSASGADPLNAITASSSGKMMAVGNMGKILYYNGSSWVPQNTMVPSVINDASFIGSIGYAVGENGSISYSADGGNTWTNQVSSSTSNLNAVYALTSSKAIAVGEGGTILVTSNSGATWSNVLGASGTLNAVEFDAANSLGLIVGTGNLVYSIDAAFTSLVLLNNSACAVDFNAVDVISDKLAFLVGNNGLMVRLTKPGSSYIWTCLNENTTSNNWPSFLSGASHNLNDVYFTDQMTGYVVGDNNLIMKTLNGGSSWSLLGTVSATGPDLNTIATSGNSNFYIGGTSSALTHITDMRDDWSTFFYYDKLGRLVVSQNSKQYAKTANTYSYTLYDALGRITEVGEIAAGTKITDQYISGQLDDNLFGTWLNSGPKTEITRTFYDQASALIPGFTQENLRTRVSSSNFRQSNTLAYDRATHYSYDIHGNVSTLIQEEVGLATVNQQFKRIDYDYDLVSGKVNQVFYQKGKADQFIHKYEYDADNRITNVYTSSDGVIWDQDAKYFYYKHGPLARTEMGDLKVQAMDYAYTLQGWIKGVNSNILTADNDIGKDGKPLGSNELHEYIPQDEYGYSLTYFKGDYIPSNTAVTSDYFLASTTGSGIEVTRKDLYNGNISAMATSINKFKEAGFHGGYANMKTFGYDQLNRLLDMTFDDNLEVSASSADYNRFNSPTVSTDYAESFTYDSNGNILTLNRNAYPTATGNNMDMMTYKYENISGGSSRNTNKLKAVLDNGDNADPAVATWPDIKSGQTFDLTTNHAGDNYQYDEIGNLVKDLDEDIASIEWTVYGKISKVSRVAGSGKDNLEFAYDASGNRICKKVTSPSGDITMTYYVRDAQSNVMATYERLIPSTGAPAFNLIENALYGSSRIGINNRVVDMLSVSPSPGHHSRLLGQKNFEESNHLGNVGVVVSDARIPVPNLGFTAITKFKTQVQSATDYYSFGMVMPGRSFTVNNGYRYGFNGKENDGETVGTSVGTQDYGMRIYNPALGRFLSVDPLSRTYPELTPYQFASNRPIDGVDQDGLEYATFTIFVQDGKVKDITVTKDYELKNPNTAGPGVQLNYAYLDKNGKITKFEAKPNVANAVYGIYAGDKNPQTPKKGGDPYKLYDDYTLDPIDEVDAAAKKHDLAYDNLYPKQVGLPGVMDDATTPANIDALNAADNVIRKYAEGGTDDITGKKVTAAEAKGAYDMSTGFYGAEKIKPLYNMPSNIYGSIKNTIDGIKKFADDVKTKTLQGLSSYSY